MPQKREGLSGRRAAAVAVAAVTLLCLGPPAAAEPVGYTVRLAPPAGQSVLYRIDLSALEFEEIGSTGLDGIYFTRLAFHADGTLYGLQWTGPESLRLVSFDLATGAGQVVAQLEHGLPDFGYQGFAGDAAGGLWVSGIYQEAGGWRGVIFAIDPAGGTVGEPVDVPAVGTGFYGLAACGDLLLATDNGLGLVEIDPFTGESTAVLPYTPNADDMDVGPDGALWTVFTIPIMPNPGYAARMDLATGETTTFGPTSSLSSLAIAPPAVGICVAGTPLAVPTLSPLALGVLVVSLAVAARWVRRRQA